VHDLVIVGGTIVDGTGRNRFTGDIAIDDGVITQIGHIREPAKRKIDADGLIVSPGWVDIHTHFDGQIMWDPDASPANMVGITTVVMGNCSVGFAPVRETDRDVLIEMMSCVEDIPFGSLKQGIPFSWSGFPEYLDSLSALELGLDVAVQVPHAALRWFVMGERAQDSDPSDDELTLMTTLLREALMAGAAGLSTSRAQFHSWKRGALPGTDAKSRELLGLGRAFSGTRAVFSLATERTYHPDERQWIGELAGMGVKVTLPALQTKDRPEGYRELLSWARNINTRGRFVLPQVATKSLGSIRCWESTEHFFSESQTYRAISDLPVEVRLQRLADEKIRDAILVEAAEHVRNGMWAQFPYGLYKLGNPPNYEPTPEMELRSESRRSGRTVERCLYDWMMERNGTELIFGPVTNFHSGDLSAAMELMVDGESVVGLSDGGAHCTILCDLAQSTFLLTHWVRDRTRGPRLELEHAIQLQTGKTADAWGFRDRGRLVPGLRADINLIDFDRLSMSAPQMAYDVPAGGRRLVQPVSGYEATIVAGEPVVLRGERTEAKPGRLIRCGVFQ
jgi:N-acyl-D-aspartate/D-glutamate deacylase